MVYSAGKISNAKYMYTVHIQIHTMIHINTQIHNAGLSQRYIIYYTVVRIFGRFVLS